MICAALLYIAGRVEREEGRRDIRWSLLAIVFVFMAIDETAAFHETLIVPVRDLLGLTGALHYGWVVPGAIGVFALGLYYVPFIFRRHHNSGLLFALAGAIFVGGALGLEMAGAHLEYTVGKTTVSYVAVSSLEEICELVGLTVFALALLRHINLTAPRLHIAAHDAA